MSCQRQCEIVKSSNVFCVRNCGPPSSWKVNDAVFGGKRHHAGSTPLLCFMLFARKVVEQQPVKWAEWTFVTLVNTPRWQPVQPGYGPPQGDGAKFCFVSNS